MKAVEGGNAGGGEHLAIFDEAMEGLVNRARFVGGEGGEEGAAGGGAVEGEMVEDGLGGGDLQRVEAR